MWRIRFAAVLAGTGCLAYAQPAPRPTFEVASVKPSGENCRGGPGSGPSPGRLVLLCIPLRGLIQGAYGFLTGDGIAARTLPVVGGPSWVDTDRFDFIAKAEGQASAAEMLGPMMQTLLEDRFALKVHIEEKETPVYALVVAKGGPKLAPAKEGSCVPLNLDDRKLWTNNTQTPCGMPKMTGGPRGAMTLVMPGVTMEQFAGRAPLRAGRPVIDKTGLTGRYDVRLEYAVEMPAGAVRPEQMEASTAPEIFTALQEQLGLKLIADKAPMKVVVIDSAEKPTGN